MQQYQYIGEPLPGYPNEYAVCRILTKEEVEYRVMMLMPEAQRVCLMMNLAAIRYPLDVRKAA